MFHFLEWCLNLPRYIRSKTEAAFDPRWGGGGEGTPQLQKEVTDTDGGGKIEVGERDFTSNALNFQHLRIFFMGWATRFFYRFWFQLNMLWSWLSRLFHWILLFKEDLWSTGWSFLLCHWPWVAVVSIFSDKSIRESWGRGNCRFSINNFLFSDSWTTFPDHIVHHHRLKRQKKLNESNLKGNSEVFYWRMLSR